MNKLWGFLWSAKETPIPREPVPPPSLLIAASGSSSSSRPFVVHKPPHANPPVDSMVPRGRNLRVLPPQPDINFILTAPDYTYANFKEAVTSYPSRGHLQLKFPGFTLRFFQLLPPKDNERYSTDVIYGAYVRARAENALVPFECTNSTAAKQTLATLYFYYLGHHVYFSEDPAYDSLGMQSRTGMVSKNRIHIMQNDMYVFERVPFSDTDDGKDTRDVNFVFAISSSLGRVQTTFDRLTQAFQTRPSIVQSPVHQLLASDFLNAIPSEAFVISGPTEQYTNIHIDRAMQSFLRTLKRRNVLVPYDDPDHPDFVIYPDQTDLTDPQKALALALALYYNGHEFVMMPSSEPIRVVGRVSLPETMLRLARLQTYTPPMTIQGRSMPLEPTMAENAPPLYVVTMYTEPPGGGKKPLSQMINELQLYFARVPSQSHAFFRTKTFPAFFTESLSQPDFPTQTAVILPKNPPLPPEILYILGNEDPKSMRTKRFLLAAWALYHQREFVLSQNDSLSNVIAANRFYPSRIEAGIVLYPFNDNKRLVDAATVRDMANATIRNRTIVLAVAILDWVYGNGATRGPILSDLALIRDDSVANPDLLFMRQIYAKLAALRGEVTGNRMSDEFYTDNLFSSLDTEKQAVITDIGKRQRLATIGLLMEQLMAQLLARVNVRTDNTGDILMRNQVVLDEQRQNTKRPMREEEGEEEEEAVIVKRPVADIPVRDIIQRARSGDYEGLSALCDRAVQAGSEEARLLCRLATLHKSIREIRSDTALQCGRYILVTNADQLRVTTSMRAVVENAIAAIVTKRVYGLDSRLYVSNVEKMVQMYNYAVFAIPNARRPDMPPLVALNAPTMFEITNDSVTETHFKQLREFFVNNSPINIVNTMFLSEFTFVGDMESLITDEVPVTIAEAKSALIHDLFTKLYKSGTKESVAKTIDSLLPEVVLPHIHNDDRMAFMIGTYIAATARMGISMSTLVWFFVTQWLVIYGDGMATDSRDGSVSLEYILTSVCIGSDAPSHYRLADFAPYAIVGGDNTSLVSMLLEYVRWWRVAFLEDEIEPLQLKPSEFISPIVTTYQHTDATEDRKPYLPVSATFNPSFAPFKDARATYHTFANRQQVVSFPTRRPTGRIPPSLPFVPPLPPITTLPPPVQPPPQKDDDDENIILMDEVSPVPVPPSLPLPVTLPSPSPPPPLLPPSPLPLPSPQVIPTPPVEPTRRQKQKRPLEPVSVFTPTITAPVLRTDQIRELGITSLPVEYTPATRDIEFQEAWLSITTEEDDKIASYAELFDYLSHGKPFYFLHITAAHKDTGVLPMYAAYKYGATCVQIPVVRSAEVRPLGLNRAAAVATKNAVMNGAAARVLLGRDSLDTICAGGINTAPNTLRIVGVSEMVPSVHERAYVPRKSAVIPALSNVESAIGPHIARLMQQRIRKEGGETYQDFKWGALTERPSGDQVYQSADETSPDSTVEKVMNPVSQALYQVGHRDASDVADAPQHTVILYDMYEVQAQTGISDMSAITECVKQLFELYATNTPTPEISLVSNAFFISSVQQDTFTSVYANGDVQMWLHQTAGASSSGSTVSDRRGVKRVISERFVQEAYQYFITHTAGKETAAGAVQTHNVTVARRAYKEALDNAKKAISFSSGSPQDRMSIATHVMELSVQYNAWMKAEFAADVDPVIHIQHQEEAAKNAASIQALLLAQSETKKITTPPAAPKPVLMALEYKKAMEAVGPDAIGRINKSALEISITSHTQVLLSKIIRFVLTHEQRAIVTSFGTADQILANFSNLGAIIHAETESIAAVISALETDFPTNPRETDPTGVVGISNIYSIPAICDVLSSFYTRLGIYNFSDRDELSNIKATSVPIMPIGVVKMFLQDANVSSTDATFLSDVISFTANMDLLYPRFSASLGSDEDDKSIEEFQESLRKEKETDENTLNFIERRKPQSIFINRVLAMSECIRSTAIEMSGIYHNTHSAKKTQRRKIAEAMLDMITSSHLSGYPATLRARVSEERSKYTDAFADILKQCIKWSDKKLDDNDRLALCVSETDQQEIDSIVEYVLVQYYNYVEEEVARRKKKTFLEYMCEVFAKKIQQVATAFKESTHIERLAEHGVLLFVSDKPADASGRTTPATIVFNPDKFSKSLVDHSYWTDHTPKNEDTKVFGTMFSGGYMTSGFVHHIITNIDAIRDGDGVDRDNNIDKGDLPRYVENARVSIINPFIAKLCRSSATRFVVAAVLETALMDTIKLPDELPKFNDKKLHNHVFAVRGRIRSYEKSGVPAPQILSVSGFVYPLDDYDSEKAVMLPLVWNASVYQLVQPVSANTIHPFDMVPVNLGANNEIPAWSSAVAASVHSALKDRNAFKLFAKSPDSSNSISGSAFDAAYASCIEFVKRLRKNASVFLRFLIGPTTPMFVQLYQAGQLDRTRHENMTDIINMILHEEVVLNSARDEPDTTSTTTTTRPATFLAHIVNSVLSTRIDDQSWIEDYIPSIAYWALASPIEWYAPADVPPMTKDSKIHGPLFTTRPFVNILSGIRSNTYMLTEKEDNIRRFVKSVKDRFVDALNLIFGADSQHTALLSAWGYYMLTLGNTALDITKIAPMDITHIGSALLSVKNNLVLMGPTGFAFGALLSPALDFRYNISDITDRAYDRWEQTQHKYELHRVLYQSVRLVLVRYAFKSYMSVPERQLKLAMAQLVGFSIGGGSSRPVSEVLASIEANLTVDSLREQLASAAVSTVAPSFLDAMLLDAKKRDKLEDALKWLSIVRSPPDPSTMKKDGGSSSEELEEDTQLFSFLLSGLETVLVDMPDAQVSKLLKLLGPTLVFLGKGGEKGENSTSIIDNNDKILWLVAVLSALSDASPDPTSETRAPTWVVTENFADIPVTITSYMVEQWIDVVAATRVILLDIASRFDQRKPAVRPVATQNKPGRKQKGKQPASSSSAPSSGDEETMDMNAQNIVMVLDGEFSIKKRDTSTSEAYASLFDAYLADVQMSITDGEDNAVVILSRDIASLSYISSVRDTTTTTESLARRIYMCLSGISQFITSGGERGKLRALYTLYSVASALREIPHAGVAIKILPTKEEEGVGVYGAPYFDDPHNAHILLGSDISSPSSPLPSLSPPPLPLPVRAKRRSALRSLESIKAKAKTIEEEEDDESDEEFVYKPDDEEEDDEISDDVEEEGEGEDASQASEEASGEDGEDEDEEEDESMDTSQWPDEHTVTFCVHTSADPDTHAHERVFTGKQLKAIQFHKDVPDIDLTAKFKEHNIHDSTFIYTAYLNNSSRPHITFTDKSDPAVFGDLRTWVHKNVISA